MKPLDPDRDERRDQAIGTMIIVAASAAVLALVAWLIIKLVA
jgi:hypothetical protein